MIKIERSIVINRPVEEVFAYATDSKNNAKWQSGLKESTLTSDGPLGVGSMIKDVRTLAGRDMESMVEVTAYEPSKQFNLKVTSGPVPFVITQTFEWALARTRIQYSTPRRKSG